MVLSHNSRALHATVRVLLTRISNRKLLLPEIGDLQMLVLTPWLDQVKLDRTESITVLAPTME